MNIELNLWFSPKSGKTFGNLNINQKEQVENIDKLLSINEFCELAHKKNLMTLDELSDFINDENTDSDALFAFTKLGSRVWWNSKKNTASVIYNGQQYNLRAGEKRRFTKGMPDVYYRG